MTDTSTRLDTFETALLAELTSMIDSSTAVPENDLEPVDHRRARRHPRRYVGIAATAAAAVAAAAIGYGLWPTPAYAVSRGSNGEVTVRVTRLEGAEGLERALKKHGIDADVTYLPKDTRCGPGRYTAVPAPGLTLSVSADEFEVTIPPGAVGDHDTFVLSAAVVPVPQGFSASVDFDIAHGAVGACRIIPAR